MADKLPTAIYEPAGRAREYAELAVNLYQGCRHGCRYCYVPQVLHKSVAAFHSTCAPRPRILEALERDAAKYAGTDKRVLLCFSCDPYPPSATQSMTTRQAMYVLGKANIPFTVLTKAGLRGTRDFDLLQEYDGWFGTTLTLTREQDEKLWEPCAAIWLRRREALVAACKQGIYTWISLEPVIVPAQTLRLLDMCKAFAHEIRIGKLNHLGHIDPELVKRYGLADIDWADFAARALEAVQATGKAYRIKDDLAKYLPEGSVTEWAPEAKSDE